MNKILGLFFIISSVLWADINGVITQTAFNDTMEESKIRTLVENTEAFFTIEDILKNETISDTERKFLEKKAESLKKVYSENFNLYYNKNIAEEVLKREKAETKFEKKAIERVIMRGKSALNEKLDLKDEREDANYFFYKEYVGELRRLITLFPKITSEIETLSEKEKQGFELNNRKVVLTFDDGPCENTQELLKHLKNENIKAVFFVQGSKIEENKSADKILKQELENGHEIGVHSLTHAKLRNLNEKSVYREIEYPKELIEKKMGYKPKFYRTPFGLRDKAALDEIEKRYSANVLWNIDSQDWRSNFTAEMVEKRVLKLAHLYNGGIILFHDTNKKSTGAMPDILKKMKRNGFEFETLSEIYSEK